MRMSIHSGVGEWKLAKGGKGAGTKVRLMGSGGRARKSQAGPVCRTGCGRHRARDCAEALDRIFDPFFTTKEVGRGSGQGLTICRSAIVDQHGGTLEFETEPGVGTTFIIQLPLHIEEDMT